jgi:hypothetical protein
MRELGEFYNMVYCLLALPFVRLTIFAYDRFLGPGDLSRKHLQSIHELRAILNKMPEVVPWYARPWARLFTVPPGNSSHN